jgi:GrpB-like predicted nucleotidyltransferase (UPF0157 family)
MSEQEAEPSGKGVDDKDDDCEIILLSGYPFYVHGPPPMEIEEVAAQVQTLLEQVCGEQLVHVSRMGSSAIPGLAGTPVCDILAELDPWPLTQTAKERLVAVGYECQGLAPHTEQDEWFFGGDAPPGHLGRVVLHTVPPGSPFVQEMQAFVLYVKSHPAAMQRYHTVKVQGARIMSLPTHKDDDDDSLQQPQQPHGRLLAYKAQKASVCNDIKKEAMEWWYNHNQDNDNK